MLIVLKINILLKAQLNVKKPEILVNPLANKINPNFFKLFYSTL